MDTGMDVPYALIIYADSESEALARKTLWDTTVFSEL